MAMWVQEKRMVETYALLLPALRTSQLAAALTPAKSMSSCAAPVALTSTRSV